MYFLKYCTLLLNNVFLGYFKSSSNLLIISAFNVLNAVFKIKDDPPWVYMESWVSEIERVCMISIKSTAACESHRHEED